MANALAPAVAATRPPEGEALAEADALPRALSAQERAEVDAALVGDQQAMQAVFEREAPALTRRLRFLCGDLASAQDLVQDTFMLAFSGRVSFGRRGSGGAWLHGIAFNLWRNQRRKRERRAGLLRELPPPNAGPDPEAQAAALELLGRLDTALQALPAKLHEAFVLRHIEGHALKDAARLADCRVSTLSARARKAEARVRAALEEKS